MYKGLSGPFWASPASQPGKRMTGLFYPRSTSLGLSGPLWASLGGGGPENQLASKDQLEPEQEQSGQPASQLAQGKFLNGGGLWQGGQEETPAGQAETPANQDYVHRLQPPPSQPANQAHDRLVLYTVGLPGPLWASQGLSGPQPAGKPAGQPASQPSAGQVSTSLGLLGLPGPPWGSLVQLWRGGLSEAFFRELVPFTKAASQYVSC